MSYTRKFLYVRFPEKYDTGVQAYAQNFIQILKKYTNNSIEIIDLNQILNAKQKKISEKSLFSVESLFIFLEELGVLREIDGVISDIGLHEHREFFFMKYLKKKMPNLNTFVTIHDPPHTVVNLFPFFEVLQRYKFFRAVRMVVNKLLGSYIEKSFFRQGHNLIVLTTVGYQRLNEKILKFGFRDLKISVHSHPYYIDVGNLSQKKIRLSGVINIGYFGYISRAKGLDRLVNAIIEIKNLNFIILNDVKIIIAGSATSETDRAYLSSLVKLTNQYGLDEVIKFTGFIENDDLPQFVSSLDLLVLPYRENGSGSASGPLMWARTLGIPVMASKSRNFSEVINHLDDGILFDNHSESLIDCLSRYILDQDLRKHLEKKSKDLSGQASWKGIATSFSDLVEAKCSKVKCR